MSSWVHDSAIVHRRQLLAAGVTRGQIDTAVRAKRWQPIAPGVYLDKSRSKDVTRSVLVGHLLAAGPGATLSHQSAAALHRFDSTNPRPEGCWISVSAKSSRRSSGQVTIRHRHADIATTAIDDLPVTTRAQTVVDLAALLTVEELERVLESALRGPDQKRPDVWRVEVLEEINSLVVQQPRSTAALIEVLSNRPPGCRPTGSIAETMLLQLLRAHSIELIRQPRVLISDGRGHTAEYFPDFIIVAGRAIIEVDGSDHFNEKRARSDAARQNNFVGFNVFRVTAAEVMFEPEKFVRTIVQHMREMERIDTGPRWILGGRTVIGVGDEWQIHPTKRT